MPTIVPVGADKQHGPRPSICPTCGLTADNAVTVRGELTATATFCDTAGHLWAVTWVEAAA